MAGTVLLVDSDADVRQRMRGILKAQGYQVMEAADGIAAWATACKQRPNVIAVHEPARLYGARALLDSIRANIAMEGVNVLLISRDGMVSEDWHEHSGVVRQINLAVARDQFLEAIAELLEISAVNPRDSAAALPDLPLG